VEKAYDGEEGTGYAAEGPLSSGETRDGGVTSGQGGQEDLKAAAPGRRGDGKIKGTERFLGSGGKQRSGMTPFSTEKREMVRKNE